MTKYLILVTLVAALPETIWAIDANCDYYEDVVAGKTYHLYNSEYPDNYSRATSCRWFAKSATKLTLSCEVSLPATADCVGDRISVSPSGNLQLTDAQNYCGTGSFNIISTGQFLNIVFTTFRGTTGGRFRCTVQATTGSTSNCNCGWKKPMRIVGGGPTGVNEYTMMAGVVDLKQRSLYCGGTIISPKYVLTAAHCLRWNVNPNESGVLVGEHDITTGRDTNSTSIHLVSSWTSHPSYDSKTQANDIAVITVVDIIVFTMAVGPACLPFQAASNSFDGSKVVALGWGTFEFAGATSDVLQKVQLDVKAVSECQQTFSEVTNNQLCTYTPGKDACQFDSGGPVLWQNPRTRRLVSVGVISFGTGCATENPGVNTRTGAYLNWIISVTPDAEYCQVE